MNELEKTIEKLLEFRDQREWSQFHNSKDLALAISIEANELLELFLWKDNEGFEVERLKEELADILSFSLFLAEKHDLDINQIIQEKIEKNSKKYPVEKSKGTSKKYTDL
jgi:NTP pyrophosphatase (non-canonical NTP hydrolase)